MNYKFPTAATAPENNELAKTNTSPGMPKGQPESALEGSKQLRQSKQGLIKQSNVPGSFL